jgi:hypothetical protein
MGRRPCSAAFARAAALELVAVDQLTVLIDGATVPSRTRVIDANALTAASILRLRAVRFEPV